MGMISEAVRHMLSAGMPHEAVIAAIDAMEQSSAADPAKPTARQERNRRYYEAKRLNEASEASENRLNRLNSDAPSPVLPKESPPAPPKEITLFTPTLPHSEPNGSSQGPKRKTGTRLDPDWVLTTTWARWAMDEFPQIDAAFVRLEADKFKDFWCSKSGKDATKMDWLATWRNWIRTAVGRMRPGQSTGAGPPLRGLAAIQDRLRRDIENEQRQNGTGSSHLGDAGGLGLLTIERH